MPAPYNDLGEKAELALAAVLTAALTGVANIFTSFQDALETPKEASWVSIQCLGGPEDSSNSGNELLTFSVKVGTSATLAEGELPGAARTRHRTNCAKVFDVIKDTGLAASWSAGLADFTVFGDITVRRGANRIEDNWFVSELLVQATCAPSDIT